MLVELRTDIQGGHKRHYRVIDFVGLKDGVPGKVSVLSSPNRSAFIALIPYDGERRYIICPKT